MLVSDLITDIHAVLEQVPDAGNYAIAVARYLDPTRDQVEFMRIGAVQWDDDDEFFLVPEGLGEILDLSERHLTASELLHDLEAQPETHGFVAYVRAKITQLDDDGTVSLNLPLWGTGVHEQAALVYFYYGECPPESGEI
jgi:hypothetical protein